ncbi:ABC transporter F family member 4 isoform X2 [Stomoxys calcitrans]|uniref:ABC transporter F family member 4 isoform X2 n=1 Tax=Stomoxys calcitrans TaxID=35570 RepID=UPI0027E23B8B|nr:ABC transporter F family member 4 isoform X2 [Stomoxys calcitrans]
MVGKLHKKKISEYTENEEYKSDLEGGDDDMVDKEYHGSASESENGDVAKHDIGKSYDSAARDRDDDEETTLGEDDDLAHGLNNSYSHGDGDDAEVGGDDDLNDDYEDSAKKAKKRKTAGAKKSLDDIAYDDDALNGVSPKKKGRKTGSGKVVTKAATKAKATKPKKSAPVEEDDDGEDEEEYEVKDIVGHKIERGVSYFLIRWKGYTKADDTWEAEDTLNCPEIIDKYKKKQSAAAPKKGAASPAAKKAKKGSAAVAKGNKKAKSGKGEDDEEDEEEEEEWEVDKIIDYAEEKKGRVFRIRWKGFGPKHDTWEPEENLNCHDIIDKFMKRMKADENLSFKELREEPKKTKRLVNETAPRTNLHNPIGRKSKRGGNKKSEERSPSPVSKYLPPPPPVKDAKTSTRLNGMKGNQGYSVTAAAAAENQPFSGENASFLHHVDWVLNKLPDMIVERMQAKIFAMLYEELGKHTPKRKGT